MNKDEQILRILKEIRPDSDFENCANYIDDFLLDSFDIINLASELEKEFDIRIKGTDIIPDHFQNVKAISNLVCSLKGRS